MLKSIRTATIVAGVSAFALPVFAQVPGSETAIDQNEAQTRENVAAESEVGVSADSPVANPTQNDTIVPGNQAEIRNNEASVRTNVAEESGTPGAGTMGSAGDELIVPGSGATFTPGTEPEGQEEVIQDEANETGAAAN